MKFHERSDKHRSVLGKIGQKDDHKNSRAMNNRNISQDYSSTFDITINDSGKSFSFLQYIYKNHLSEIRSKIPFWIGFVFSNQQVVWKCFQISK